MISNPNYTELEYIESTGVQCLNTGIAVDNENSFQIDCFFLADNADTHLISQGNNSLRINGTSITWYSRDGHHLTSITLESLCEISCGLNYLIVNENSISATTDTDNASGTYVYLFSKNDGTAFSKARVKCFRIYDSLNNLLFNGIPAKRNADNKAGLYDAVNDNFIFDQNYNFVMGPVVPQTVNPPIKQLQVQGVVYDLQVDSVNNCNPTATETSKYDWMGTQAEYIAQNVQANHPNWVCFITDDVSNDDSSIIDLSNYVKRTNSVNETITGTKTFDTGIQIVRTSGQRLITRKDNNDVAIGSLESVDNGNSNKTELFVFGENGTDYAIMGIDHNNGSPYSYAPTPSALSNNDTVVTTAYVTTILSTLYPVGSLYLGTQTTCPLATLIPGSTWSLVSSGKALWTGNGTSGSGTTVNTDYANAAANTTIEAGVPNITGTIKADTGNVGATGAFTHTATENDPVVGNWGATTRTYSFNAANSNSIYGNSSTVQPPAYVTNVWRRTA